MHDNKQYSKKSEIQCLIINKRRDFLMQKYLILLLFVIIELQTSKAEIISYMPERIDYNQVIVRGDSIIAYGNEGVVFLTHNNGKKWQKVRVFDIGVIPKIFDEGDKLVAFRDNGEISLSKDYGLSWKSISRLKDSVHTIIKYPEGYLVRSINRIFTINSNFQETNSYNYKSEKYLLKNSNYSRGGYLYLRIGRTYSMAYYKDKFVILGDSSRLFIIDKNFKQSSEFDINKLNISRKIDTTCHLFADDEYLYFGVVPINEDIKYSIYKTNNFETASKFIDINEFYSEFRIIGKTKYLIESDGNQGHKVYEVKSDGSLIEKFNYTDNSFSYKPEDNERDSYRQYPNDYYIDETRFIKVGAKCHLGINYKNSNKLNFLSDMSRRVGRSSTERINDSTYLFFGGFTDGMIYSDIYISRDSGVTIAPLFNKSEDPIFQSYISYFYNNAFYHKKKKLLYMFGGDKKYNYPEYVPCFEINPETSEIKKKDIDIKGNNLFNIGMYGVPITETKEKGVEKYLFTMNCSSFDSPAFELYILDNDLKVTKRMDVKGKLVKHAIMLNDSTYYVLYWTETKRSGLAFTKDYCKTWQDVVRFDSLPNGKIEYVKDVRINGKDYIYFTYRYDATKKVQLYCLEIETGKINSKLLESFSIIGADYDENTIYLTINDQVYLVKDPMNEETMEFINIDKGATIEFLQKFGNEFYGILTNPRFKHYPLTLYGIRAYYAYYYWIKLSADRPEPIAYANSLDFGKRSIKHQEAVRGKITVKNASNTEILKIYGYSTASDFKINLPADLWKTGLTIGAGESYEFEVEFFPKEERVYTDTIQLFGNVYEGSLKFSLNGEGVNIGSTNEPDYIYVDKPYPIPAKNIVNIPVYWDVNKEYDASLVSVYDVSGREIDIRDRLGFERLSQYHGLIKWNCEGSDKGLYLIKIRHGSETRISKVIISE